jgi:hypothetical protein
MFLFGKLGAISKENTLKSIGKNKKKNLKLILKPTLWDLKLVLAGVANLYDK